MMPNDFFYSGYTPKFADIWSKKDEFISDYKTAKVGFYEYDGEEKAPINDNSLSLLFDLLFARYGFSTVMNTSIDQFKYGVYSVIFMYGPTWEERINLQRQLINISDEELREGSKAIFNHAFNPSTAPSTSSTEELNYINDQNTTKYKKSKMDAISFKWDLLKTDVTKQFLDKFEDLFIKIVGPYTPVHYITEVEELS